jgi:hypothetical protein
VRYTARLAYLPLRPLAARPKRNKQYVFQGYSPTDVGQTGRFDRADVSGMHLAKEQPSTREVQDALPGICGALPETFRPADRSHLLRLFFSQVSNVSSQAVCCRFIVQRY